MKPDEVKVTFQPSGRSVFVLPGTPLLEAAGLAGIILQTPCGGRGTCGKCRVRIAEGESPFTEEQDGPLTGEDLREGWRLACGTRVQEGLVVEIPEESLFEHSQKILVEDSGATAEVNPVLRKLHFSLALPTSEDPMSDAARLRKEVGEIEISPNLLRDLPGFLRRGGWTGTAVLSDHTLMALEEGDTTESLRGVAFDLGTTTIVGKLYDLADGRELALASRINPQVSQGDDVLSRILKIREDPGKLADLQRMIVGTINEVTEEVITAAGVPRETVYEFVVAGNATMQQVFCGFDPSALGEVPFVPVFEDALSVPAVSLGVAGHPAAEVYVFPQIGGFVGGDTVSGMVASRLDQWGKPMLFVDIGTNGEIVLAHDGQLLATSTAAGPAFEGARIKQGMRATSGAIEKVIIGEDVILNVIGNVAPAGICGTALIDTAAGLLRAGIVDETGRILPAEEAPDDLPPALRERLVTEDGETRFLLAAGENAGRGEAIYIWQRDIRELQLASGAIRAGIQILLRRAGLEPSDLHRVLLAGAFGNFIRRSSARRVGLLPQMPCERIRFIGNAAALGAKLVLLSADERDYAARLCRTAEHVDLSLDADFQMEFGMSMMFPDRDFDHCSDES